MLALRHIQNYVAQQASAIYISTYAIEAEMDSKPQLKAIVHLRNLLTLWG